jgi:hypothetical protein
MNLGLLGKKKVILHPVFRIKGISTELAQGLTGHWAR